MGFFVIFKIIAFQSKKILICYVLELFKLAELFCYSYVSIVRAHVN
ncbi:hypothetical protein RO3G_04067 [Rhizopus delemar RA 99-880]|uniref:Uncharacterized protein n=1 Tax=Rhizopus delemar (strain RA 99-880 / ATCC MYA-4621 / FGSC 9543 / NRRL 43880) TaxID=246409 RepID=I1BT32_RHIO9|nr:hypothetical protein RO3G_04067 [Rhizopus delemar RA 99-880]|eukprot:EIE79362.1 hypothetical protein RO3G_04067 [Rhizopus delemar RA 99-880]